MLCQALCIISKSPVNSNLGYSLETLNSGQNRRFFPCELEIRRITLKNIKAPFFATSSFVYHFIAIGQFKLELQSGNAQFGTKSTIFVPCDLEIWQMTLKNYKAPLLYNFKLCASFHSHLWIQTGVRARNAQFGSKSAILCSVWLWNLTDDLEKQ